MPSKCAMASDMRYEKKHNNVKGASFIASEGLPFLIVLLSLRQKHY